jgi:hypothetical protein
MKTFFKKTVLACSVAAASLFAATAAHADATFNSFGVSHTEGGVLTQFTADKMTGNYNEIISFDGLGGFAVSLFWSAGQFVTDNGETAVKAGVSRLGVDYGVYGTYMARGSVSTDSSNKTTFTFIPGSGSLTLYLDEKDDTKKVNPLTGYLAFDRSNTDDDVIIANGNPLAGAGNLDPNGPNCGPGKGIECGSFGSKTSFALTVPGMNFFTSPSPFYDLSFQSGQLNNFTLSGNQTINGSLDVTFARVPEPATTALFGLGLLGLCLTARRRKQS